MSPKKGKTGRGLSKNFQQPSYLFGLAHTKGLNTVRWPGFESWQGRRDERDGPSGWSANSLTGRFAVRTRPLPLDFYCLGLGDLALSHTSCLRTGRSVVRTQHQQLDFSCPDLGNLAVPQSSFFLPSAWQLDTRKNVSSMRRTRSLGREFHSLEAITSNEDQTIQTEPSNKE
ncbi:hypothetical protein T265_02754 [Opisthorchis viverrini]|uniref:Uncharacterized protein n=1 Tax=Opisthorchis viverrini TaxID=6198 RepID=A0A074ZTY4_OPIVI|nr:hypothetical protein T265_02754 [Opisthorchis viverrini]KER30943.1 hypothetical protein T265_02754 [Opisthorchis viverrini]